MKADKEYLDMVIGGQVVRDMSSITFIGVIAGKLNGVKTYTAANQELSLMVSNPPMGYRMPDDEKIRIIKKLESIGVTL